MMKKASLHTVIRVLLGVFFIVSGGEKLLSPYQNFLYVVQGYQIFPPFLEEVVARVVPWVETFLGIFLALGLWTRLSLTGIMVMLAGFITIVSQALIRKLPVDECGCFGSLIAFPLHKVLMLDSGLFFLVVLMLMSIEKTKRFSLDDCF